MSAFPNNDIYSPPAVTFLAIPRDTTPSSNSPINGLPSITEISCSNQPRSTSATHEDEVDPLMPMDIKGLHNGSDSFFEAFDHSEDALHQYTPGASTHDGRSTSFRLPSINSRSTSRRNLFAGLGDMGASTSIESMVLCVPPSALSRKQEASPEATPLSKEDITTEPEVGDSGCHAEELLSKWDTIGVPEATAPVALRPLNK